MFRMLWVKRLRDVGWTFGAVKLAAVAGFLRLPSSRNPGNITRATGCPAWIRIIPSTQSAVRLFGSEISLASMALDSVQEAQTGLRRAPAIVFGSLRAVGLHSPEGSCLKGLVLYTIPPESCQNSKPCTMKPANGYRP